MAKTKRHVPRKTARGAASTKERPQPHANQTKLARVIAMLKQPDGATIDAIADATGWQRHSVRGAIAGTIKKKLGLTVKSERRDDGRRVYSIA